MIKKLGFTNPMRAQNTVPSSRNPLKIPLRKNYKEGRSDGWQKGSQAEEGRYMEQDRIFS
jgi:hypothetical protein